MADYGGYDYGNPVADAIKSYTTLRSSFLADKEFEHRKTIEQQNQQRQDEIMRMSREEHQHATKKWEDEQASNEIAGNTAEWSALKGQPPSPDLVKRTVALSHKHSVPLSETVRNRLLTSGKSAPSFDTLQQAFAADPRLGVYLDPKFAQQRADDIDATMNAFGNLVREPEAPTGAVNPIEQGPTNQLANKMILLNKMTAILKPELMAGKLDDGNSPRDAAIIDYAPSMDGKRVGLHVRFTRQDGSQYNAPITKNRSADPNDPVLFVPITTFTDRLATERSVISALQAASVHYGDTHVRGMLQKLSEESATRDQAVQRYQKYIESLGKQADEAAQAGDKKLAGFLRDKRELLLAGDTPEEIEKMMKDDPRMKEVEGEDWASFGYGQVKYKKGPNKGKIEQVPVKPEKAGVGSSGGGGKPGAARKADERAVSMSGKLWQEKMKIANKYAVKKGTYAYKETVHDGLIEQANEARRTYINQAQDFADTYNEVYAPYSDPGKKQAIGTPAQGKPEATVKHASVNDVKAAIKGAKTREEAANRLKAKGFTHDEEGRPL